MSFAQEQRREKVLETLEQEAKDKSQPIWNEIKLLEEQLSSLDASSQDGVAVNDKIAALKKSLEVIWSSYNHLYMKD
ncbi:MULTISPECIES: hypothetical protein [Vibrionaceae]|uniref:Uncharacterized protein n=1 Tax=Enterovibrio norvegicus FF-454 TaxID=1185651 RepID=A0A1E5BYP6_9GAMM|nr:MULTISPECIES: hypothetical protein [Vibrionaceae]OEE58377.1 hypothetical protein A1OK_15385 [Enterovibrio norvegicus FF-454]PTO75858.1 hypothetical protein CWN81_04700 [Vibrio splendidus]PTP30267.1 hypothetical protein CWN92_09085 [Vibrio splendidus]